MDFDDGSRRFELRQVLYGGAALASGAKGVVCGDRIRVYKICVKSSRMELL